MIFQEIINYSIKFKLFLVKEVKILECWGLLFKKMLKIVAKMSHKLEKYTFKEMLTGSASWNTVDFEFRNVKIQLNVALRFLGGICFFELYLSRVYLCINIHTAKFTLFPHQRVFGLNFGSVLVLLGSAKRIKLVRALLNRCVKHAKIKRHGCDSSRKSRNFPRNRLFTLRRRSLAPDYYWIFWLRNSTNGNWTKMDSQYFPRETDILVWLIYKTLG